MKNRISLWIQISIASIVLLTSLPGCTEPPVYNTEKLSNVAMSSDVDEDRRAINPTDTFKNDTPRILCSFKLVDSSSVTSVTAQWIYINRDMSYYPIDTWTEPAKPGYMAMFIRRPSKGWPIGDYKVILYIDDEEELVVPFKIK